MASHGPVTAPTSEPGRWGEKQPPSRTQPAALVRSWALVLPEPFMVRNGAVS